MYRSNRRNVERALTNAENRALEKVGLFVESRAALLSPVDTGRLRDSIDHEVDERRKSVTIGTPVKYAINVEKGTSRQRAQPYLTPAAENNLRQIKNIVQDELRRGMN